MASSKSTFFSFLANANQKATHRVIEAVVADHGGTDKCPWSAAEMEGNYTRSSLLLLRATESSYMYVIIDVPFFFKISIEYLNLHTSFEICSQFLGIVPLHIESRKLQNLVYCKNILHLMSIA